MRRIPLAAVMVLVAALSACGPFVRTVDVGPQGTVGGIAVHSASGMVYVANYDGASITRFPNGGGAKVTIATPAKPSGVAVVQKTGNVFVLSEAEGTLTVLGHDDAVVATLPVCAGPVAVAALDAENLVFVSCRDSQELVGVFGGDSPALPKVVFRVPLPSRPADVAVLNPSRSAFVVLKHDDPSAPERIGHFRYVPIGAGATVSLTRTIDLPDAPVSIAGNSHTQEVLVGLRNGRIALIDGTENHTDVHYTVVRSFPVDTGNEAIVASKLAINEGSDDLLMAYGERRQSGSSRVDSRTPISGTSVIDVVDERRLPLVSSVAFPGAAAADPATGRFYVTSIMANTVVELTDPAYQDNLVLPVRWCILQGSAMAKGVTVPAGQEAVWPSPAIGDELADLTGQVTNQVWWPSGAHISFFAAAASDVPVIIDAEHDATGTCRNDARPPELKGGDCPGDIDGTSGVGQGGEGDQAGALCRATWLEKFPHTKGPIAIFARDLSNTSDTGHTVIPPSISNSPALCQSPRTVTVDQLPSVVIVHDIAQFENTAYDQLTNVAHELGHALLLGHGNGLDDNDPKTPPLSPGPREYDEYCDAAESTVGSDRNLMGPTAGDRRTLTALQVETARDIVHAYFTSPPRCKWKRNCH